ncbi:p-hydroxybenzoate 3-monooxygenase [Stella humosa]|uniref:p-hydroxybenzoate 3-monooxygenase n=1 Tax=Stella humosa TaxID=94 RepID=A0A3N1L0T0_9PROT|nr:4-hydroxybenzoate 3-monooxygenase [Stella humosa]ROP84208.1 p-hydroxybenzoate 3-monooxygenase [Stella humosa]BBK33720.1 4-hydroxybenzoate 3-monooxygenase [Stella humosa]
MRTQVGIVGAGPAGLILAHLLRRAGIDSVVLEARSRPHVESRIRAGVLEQGTVDLIAAAGLGARMQREGLVHHGIELRFAGRRHRIDLHGLSGGRAITVYGQHELVKDLIAARLADGDPIRFGVEDVRPEAIDSARPRLRFRQDGAEHVLECDFIAGCDGFHGVCRGAIPAGALTIHERHYPFAWLGILAEAPPVSEELIYAGHARGFALFSMRSPTLSRLYLQCAPDEDPDDWSEDRLWSELSTRLAVDGGVALPQGPIVQKGVTGMRSFVAEPMRFGRLFLAGDAAHIVPPTGAKGLNLAVADVQVLARALAGFFGGTGTAGLDGYSATCLDRVWRVQRFSWWMTALLHRFPDEDPFDRRLRAAELAQLADLPAAAAVLACNYVGLPIA